MRSHLSTFIVSLIAMMVPWAIVGAINVVGATTNSSVLQHMLYSGGHRGRLIDGVLYAIPTVLLGGVAGFALGPAKLGRMFIWLGVLALMAWFNLSFVVAATDQWPTKLLRGQNTLVIGRLAQIVFFVGIGMLFGCGAKANNIDAHRNAARTGEPAGGS